MAVGGVGIEGDVGEDREIGEFFFEGAESTGNQALGIQASLAVLGAKGGFDAGEDGDTTDAALRESGRVAEKGGDGVTKVAGEAGDWGGRAGTVFDKERGDEMGRADGSLGKQSADAGGTAKTATSDWNGKPGIQGGKIIPMIFEGQKVGNVREYEREGKRAKEMKGVYVFEVPVIFRGWRKSGFLTRRRER